MKKLHFLWLFVILMGVAILITGYQKASANNKGQDLQVRSTIPDYLAAPTLLPTPLPVSIGNPTPESRVLPAVGSNAGLVIGASVLVLIIIGGVLSARLRRKH